MQQNKTKYVNNISTSGSGPSKSNQTKSNAIFNKQASQVHSPFKVSTVQKPTSAKPAATPPGAPKPQVPTKKTRPPPNVQKPPHVASKPVKKSTDSKENDDALSTASSRASLPLPDDVSWELVTPESADRLLDKAVVAGYEGWDGSPLWIIRSKQENATVPGKLAIKHKAAYVPYKGKEVSVQNIEVLCAPTHRVKWIEAKDGIVPFAMPVSAGTNENGDILYIGRAKHNDSLTPGKVDSRKKCCYISFGGKEIEVSHYEVLCIA